MHYFHLRLFYIHESSSHIIILVDGFHISWEGKLWRIEARKHYKARGAFLLETDCGLKLYKSFEGSKNRALFEDKVKQHLFLNGYPNTDLFVRTIEDEILSEDSAGCQYIMKSWFWGEECNLKELSQIETAAANLGRLHSVLKGVEFTAEQMEHNISSDLMDTFDKGKKTEERI